MWFMCLGYNLDGTMAKGMTLNASTYHINIDSKNDTLLRSMFKFPDT